MRLESGATVGSHQIDAPLGAGGMGEAYKTIPDWRRTIAASVLAVGWMLFSTDVAAQTREGLWFGVGVGVGSAGGSSDELAGGTRKSGGGYSLSGGWALRDHVVIGGEVNAWRSSAGVEGTSLQMSNVSGTVSYFPSPAVGFFVKSGVGVSSFGVGRSCGQVGGPVPGFPPLATTTDGTAYDFGGCEYHGLGSGLAVLGGAGYDIPLGRVVALTVSTNLWYGVPGRLKLAEETLVRHWKQHVIDLMVGITFR